jgi:hypothetical protein
MAVVCAICIANPVDGTEVRSYPPAPEYHISGQVLESKSGPDGMECTLAIKRPPTGAELAMRLAWAWPVATVALLVSPWFISRIKPPFVRG